MEEASCYELCKTPPSFLGLTPAISPGEHGQRVLVTSVTDGAQLFHADKRECLKSWSSSLEEAFSAPCVLQNGRLFAVQNERTLCSWDPKGYLSAPPPQLTCSSTSASRSATASSSLSSSLLSLVSSSSSSATTTTTLASSVKHRTFPHSIYKLHASEHNPSELILILANGAVAAVSANPDPSLPAPLQLLESLVTSNIPKGKGTLVASCVNFHKDRTFVAYLRIPAAGSTNVKTACYMSIFCIHAPQGTRKVEEVGHGFGFRAPRLEDCKSSLGVALNHRGGDKDDGKAVTPVAFDWQLQSRTVGLIWSNGLFQALKFEPYITHLDSLAKPPREVYLRPLTDYHVPSLSLAFIGFNFVGITGKASNGDTRFVVFETIYGTQPVPTITLSPSSTPALTSTPSLTSSSSSHKKRKAPSPEPSDSSASSTVVSADGLYCFCTLAAVWVVRLPTVLPCQAASLAVAVGCLKEQSALTQPPVSGRLDLLRALAQVTENSNLCATMDTAIRVCDEEDHSLLKVLESGDVSAIDSTFKRYLGAMLGPSPKPGKVLSHTMITRLAERTLALHCWSIFELVLQSQVFSARNLPNVVSVLIEHKQTRCLELCVANVHDLDETHLVQALQYGLEQRPPLISLVDAVLAARHSDSFLHNALKALSQKSFALLLAHLVNWLSVYWEAPQEDAHAVTLPQVLNWCSIVLDANFVDLILPSSPCHEQLAALQKAVSLHMSLANALTHPADVLNALCSSMEAKRAGQKVEPQPAIADYSVELLVL